jgi:hypothetical protein
MLNTKANNRTFKVRQGARCGYRRPGRPENIPINNRDPKGAEQDARHEFCTPGSMAGLAGNCQSYATAAIFPAHGKIREEKMKCLNG